MTSRFPSLGGRRRVASLFALGCLTATAVVVAPDAGAVVRPAAPVWTIESSPDVAGAYSSGLHAVSCAGPGSCMAVGSAVTATPSHDQLALIEHLSGGTWTITPNPADHGANASPLVGVSCPSPTFCAAVGYARYSPPHVTFEALAETWDGSSWTKGALPVPAGGSEPNLAGVSCPAAGHCVAVGNYITKTDHYRPLAERLSGGAWSILPEPDPHGISGNSEFTAIDCAAPSMCEAVGNVSYNDTLQSVFAYGLSGSAWTAQRPVNPGPTPGNTDNGVSCSATDDCTSVGSIYVVQETALAEYWNGSTWVRQTTPAPVDRPENTLFDVSCVSGASCVAVGASARVNPTNGHLGPYRVMAEVWDGTTWSQSPPAEMPGATIALEGVSCPSPTACIAVGSSTAPAGVTTLVEAYAG